MTVQLLHLSDLHFGGLANIEQVEALEAMIPDLRPDAVVITGDMSQRARHGENLARDDVDGRSDVDVVADRSRAGFDQIEHAVALAKRPVPALRAIGGAGGE